MNSSTISTAFLSTETPLNALACIRPIGIEESLMLTFPTHPIKELFEREIFLFEGKLINKDIEIFINKIFGVSIIDDLKINIQKPLPFLAFCFNIFNTPDNTKGFPLCDSSILSLIHKSYPKIYQALQAAKTSNIQDIISQFTFINSAISQLKNDPIISHEYKKYKELYKPLITLSNISNLSSAQLGYLITQYISEQLISNNKVVSILRALPVLHTEVLAFSKILIPIFYFWLTSLAEVTRNKLINHIERTFLESNNILFSE